MDIPHSLPSWFDDVINGKPEYHPLTRQIERTGALKRLEITLLFMTHHLWIIIYELLFMIHKVWIIIYES